MTARVRQTASKLTRRGQGRGLIIHNLDNYNLQLGQIQFAIGTTTYNLQFGQIQSDRIGLLLTCDCRPCWERRRRKGTLGGQIFPKKQLCVWAVGGSI